MKFNGKYFRFRKSDVMANEKKKNVNHILALK